VRDEPLEARVLREDERAVVLGQRAEQLDEPLELPGASLERTPGREDDLGVVADLLELQHRRQHQAPALDALALLHPGQHVVHDRLVERGLLAGQGAVDPRFELVRQILDHVRIGLDPP